MSRRAKQRLLVVAAEGLEIEGLRGASKECRRLAGTGLRQAWEMEFDGCSVVAVANGPGHPLAGLAAREALAGFAADVDAVASYGVCGGLDPRLAVGDVIAGSAVCWAERDCRYTARVPEGVPAVGTIYSVNRVVGEASEKQRLFALGFAAVEMEAGAVAEAAAAAGKVFYCVRAVSDDARTDFGIDLNAARDAAGGFQKGLVLGMALRHPFRGVRELLRLRSNAAKAAAQLGAWFARSGF